MTKIDSWMVLVLYGMIAAFISFYDPSIFGRENTFLEGFVDHNFLSFMGVVVTITLASTTNVHMALVRMEKDAKKEVFSGTKNKVRLSAYSLIWLLSISVILVFVKPLVPQIEEVISLINAACLAIIIWGILVISDITKLAFKV